MTEERFLLHICCAPCSPHPLRTLKREFTLTLYFFNPNIHPRREYMARLSEAERLAATEGLPLVIGEYAPRGWLEATRHLKREPERGKRCEFCIGQRLEETARKAHELGISRFGTVLSVSRNKSSIMINSLGKLAAERLGGIHFQEADWKKRNGFDLSAEAARELGFVRQDYCGCAFSLATAREKKRNRLLRLEKTNHAEMRENGNGSH